MAEAEQLSAVWWDVATAITYLREGSLPAQINWRSLPDFIKEMRELNAAIQAGNIDVIEVTVDGRRRELATQDKALTELRFSEQAFIGGNIGVILEVIDVYTGERRRQVQKLLLRAEQVLALRSELDMPDAIRAADVPTEDAESSPVALSRQYSRPQSSRVEIALKEIYGDVLPSEEQVPEAEMIRRLKKFMGEKNWKARPDRKTLQRVIRKKRPSTS